MALAVYVNFAIFSKNCCFYPKNFKFQRQFVDDVRSLLRVLVMFLPVPIFWAIYDQQGSLWTIQALEMNCRIWGEKDSQYLLLPDQMQTLNAVLILAFIPIFQVSTL